MKPATLDRKVRSVESDIELLPALATVAAWQCDAIWTAPTLDGAVLRAKLCLRDGHDAGEVASALALWDGIQ